MYVLPHDHWPGKKLIPAYMWTNAKLTWGPVVVSYALGRENCFKSVDIEASNEGER